MTYTLPTLTLIGSATDVVLGELHQRPFFDSLPVIEPYDPVAVLEAEW